MASNARCGITPPALDAEGTPIRMWDAEDREVALDLLSPRPRLGSQRRAPNPARRNPPRARHGQTLYDGLDHVVRELLPDGSRTERIYGPWQVTEEVWEASSGLRRSERFVAIRPRAPCAKWPVRRSPRFTSGLCASLPPTRFDEAREHGRRYAAGMATWKAHVENGRLKLDEPTDLPEGTVVPLEIADDWDDLDEEERAALRQSIGEGIEDMEAGRTVDARTAITELRGRS